MVSVGVLAAIVNFIALFTVCMIDRVVELVVRNFAAIRLRKERRAPVVHDSDTWLPNIPRSVIKYHKHPAILTTVLLAGVLIFSEIITELGVDVSNKCSPVKKSSKVITNADSSNSFTEIELGTSAFFLQTTTFLDGELERVPAGLPRSIKGTECLVCMKPEKYPDIISGCSIADDKVYEPGQLSVSIMTTSGPFKTITSGMKEIGGSGNFSGKGDLTFNGVWWSSFLFYMSGSDLVYLEYSNQDHLPRLVDSARKNQNNVAPGPIESRVVAKRVKCSTNQLSSTNFRDAVSIYRTIQLENTIKPATFVPEQKIFQNLTTGDIYRAVLSVKVIDDDLAEGEFFQYTTCGRYNWVFLLPILLCIAAILVLYVVSRVLQTGFDASKIPYNSRSWFTQSHGSGTGKKKMKGRVERTRSGYFDSIFDEMIILEEGIGKTKSTKIGLRTKDGRVAPLASASPKFAFFADQEADTRLAQELSKLGNVEQTTEVEVATPEENEQEIEAVVQNDCKVSFKE